jgi:hypothetical protein
MARIDFHWSEPTLNTYDHINSADFFTALPADYKADGKPLLVFVTSGKDEDKIEMQNIENGVLRDESVSIGATMFRSIKVKGESVNKGHPFYSTLGGKDLPSMIVVDANGQKVGAEEGKVSASRVFALMKRAAARTYKQDLETIVKETKSILTDIDQVEAKRTALATKREKSVNDRSAQWAKEEKELDAAMKAIEARETALKRKWSEERVAKS